MQFKASSRYIRISPYKLRPMVDVVRGKDAQYALHWLQMYAVKKANPVFKMIASAVANAQHGTPGLQSVDLVIKDIRVDQGPILKYFKPGAMGRANIQRRKFSHMSVVLEPKMSQRVTEEKVNVKRTR